MPTVLDCSLEPILDSTLQINKAFPHGSDLVVSAHVMTGLSWQPSWGTEHTYRSFRLDGIRCLAEHVTHTTVLPPDTQIPAIRNNAAGGIIERSHSNTVIDYESPNAALSSPCLHLRTFHTASPTRTSATGPYQCAVVRNTGGARDAPRYSKDSPSPRKPQRPLLRSLQMIADPAATPINPIGTRTADQYGARVEVNEGSDTAMKSALRATEQQAATNDAMARWLTGNLCPRNRRRYCLAIQPTQNAKDAAPP